MQMHALGVFNQRVHESASSVPLELQAANPDVSGFEMGRSPNMLKFTIKLLLARSNNYVLTGTLCNTCNCHCFWRSLFIYLHSYVSVWGAREQQSGWKACVWSSCVLILFSGSIFLHTDLLPGPKKAACHNEPKMKTFACTLNVLHSAFHCAVMIFICSSVLGCV